MRHLRYIDIKLDEAEKMADDPDAVWIDEKDFWAEDKTSVQSIREMSSIQKDGG